MSQGNIDYDFDYKDAQEQESDKEGIVVFGQKGSGKTSGAYLLSGTKVVLSFDGKSLRAKETMRPDDQEITVLNARKYVTHFKTRMTEYGKKTIQYCIFLLDETKKRGGCDWVIIDGLDVLIEQAEMAMRYDNKLGPLEAFARLGIWKDRKLNIRMVHEAAFACAKKGVVWTTYTDKDEVVNNATLVSKKDVPKWMDIVMYDTDVVLKAEAEVETNRFFIKVISSKVKRFKTGDVYDVTNVRTFEKAKKTGRLASDEQVDLGKAIKRRKARQAIERENCPRCGSEVAVTMGMLACTKCEWVHEDEAD